MKVQHREVIQRQAAEIFEAFEDPEVIAQWQANMLEFKQLEGSFTEIGGVALMKTKNVGVTTDMTVTVLDRNPARCEVKYGYEGAQAPFTLANKFEDLGDGSTEWSVVLEAKLPLIAKALELALKPLASELVKNNGKHFRTWCEAEL